MTRPLLLLLVLAACRAVPDPQPSSWTTRPSQECAAPSEQDSGPLARLRTWLADLPLAPGSSVGVPAPQSQDLGSALVSNEGGGTPQDGGDWLLAPVPFVDPTIGAGLALGAAYLRPLDPGSPPSTIGGGVLASENGSLGAALGFQGHLDEDRVRVTLGAVATRLEFGLQVGAVEVPLSESVLGLAGEVLVRVAPDTYVGPQVLFSAVDSRLQRESDSGRIPADQLDAVNVAVGLHGQHDTRDSSFYPRRGSLLDLQVRHVGEALGSSFAYQVLPLSWNGYHSLDPRTVLALRMAGRVAWGDVPFYGKSYVGAGGDLRGYPVGSYYDDVLLAAQAELRRELVGDLGGVLFAGLGTVAPDLGEVGSGPSLPSAGFGLRYTLEETNHVNFRVDLAWGRDEAVLYLGVGEAF